MKDKKTLKIGSIIVAVLIAIVCITKILASGGGFENGEEWQETSWGYYITTEDGEELYSKEGYKSKKGKYTEAESLPDKLYYDDLKSIGSIFCVQQGAHIPSKTDEGQIRTWNSSAVKTDAGTSTGVTNQSPIGDGYKIGEAVYKVSDARALSSEEKNALQDKNKGDANYAIKGDSYNCFAEDGKVYYSRELGKIEAKNIETYATQEDGTISFTGVNKDITVSGATRIPWADAYVLAKSDPMAAEESNEAQLALWKLAGFKDNIKNGTERLNTGKSENGKNEGDKLLKEAILFETYRQDREEEEKNGKVSGPQLIDEKNYTYKFNVQGNYLIAGPVQIKYGDLKLTSAEGAELEVRQIENFTVWGTLADSDELKDITENVKFTDENGNELSEMNETTGNSEGEGAGKKFPKSEQKFYIKVDYNDPIYTKVVAINSLEVSFKELDVKAVGFKIKDIPITYTEWVSNNIMYESCKEEHNYQKEEKTTETYYNPNMWTGQYDWRGNPIFGGLDSREITNYVSDSDEFDASPSNHLKNNCKNRGICNRFAHINCRVNKLHEDIEGDPSKGVLLKGDTTDEISQNLFVMRLAELYWRKYKLVVLFGPENDNPPSGITPPPSTGTPKPPSTGTPNPPSSTPSPSHRTYIDIGGNVWVDDVESKVGSQDGPDGINGTGTDYPRKNVKVTLYFEDGTIVNESDVAEWARDKFENPTYTDEDGNYMFYQLPMDKKYYVEFTYDGMMYTTVDFLATDGDVSKYKDSPNDEVYKTNSKAEEQESKRKEFNNRFAEITGGNPIAGGKTEGTAIDESKRTTLEYKTNKFNTDILKSRLRTTDEEKDVEEDHATGKAKEDFEMTVRTSDKQLIYPFGDEYIMFDAKNPDISQLEYLKYINLGLKRRTTADLSLAVDIKAGGTAIKDKTKLVVFRANAKEEEMKATMTEKDNDGIINDTKVKAYTNGKIVQDIAGTDYYWLTNLNDIYTSNNPYGDGKQDSLNVYVLYKIIVANQSELDSTNATITSLVDYYSKGLTLPTDTGDQERINKIFEPLGANGSYSWVEDGPAVTWNKVADSNGFNTIKADMNLKIGGSGETKAIYLVLKVEEKNDLLDTNELKNITEIASYKIHDKKGDALGLVDCDSAPCNATPGNENTYEDDTDDAPVFKLDIKNQPKVIEGNVWEDLSGTPGVGDKKINGVKVELIEYAYKDGDIVAEVIRPGLTLKEDNTIGVKTTTYDRTGQDGEAGHYKFFVEGGNYAVKFTYGDETMLETNRKYNAQDYQASKAIYKPLSKIYTEDFNMAKATTDELISYLSNKGLVTIPDLRGLTQQPWETEEWGKDIENIHSNARDLAEYRIKAITNAIDLTNSNATILKTLNDEGGYGVGNVPKGLTDYTYMESISDIVIMESNDLAQKSKIVNLALKERPQMSIDLDKKVSKIVVKTNDGTELINTSDASKLSNLQELEKEYQSVFINMDTKSMEGATIDIDYTLTVKNTSGSENSDKLSNYLYLTGENARSAPTSEKYIVDKGEDFSNLITTLNGYFGESIDMNSELPIKANEIYDYVNINLEFRADDNKNDDGNVIWEKVYDNEGTVTDNIPGDFVTQAVKDQLNKDRRKVTKVIRTTEYAENKIKNLYTAEEKNIATIPVHLGITLSEDIEGDNRTDDFDAFAYSNCAEIIQIYSGAGRRDYDIIPGNYVPYDKEPVEPDEQWTGSSVITPPLGENRIYYVITIISATIVIAGIVLIKKKVLKK